jgi:hypothetical protein
MDARNWKKRTRDWHGSYILQILKDDGVLGWYQPCRWIGGERVSEGAPIKCYPEVVDPVLVARARRAVEGRRLNGKGRKGRVYANIVTGLGKCPICDGGLYRADPGPGQGQPKLVCYNAKLRKCTNRVRFPYRVFETALLSMIGVGMQRIIADLTPTETVNFEQPIAEAEAAIASKQANLDALFDQFLRHTSATARETANRRSDLISKQLDDERAGLDRLRRNSRTFLLTKRYDQTFDKRFKESVARLNSNDREEQYRARAMLAQEFRQRIDEVSLRVDGNIDIQIHDGRGSGAAAVLAMNPEGGICGFQYVNRKDGSPLENTFGAFAA